jgi:hypothetical protein
MTLHVSIVSRTASSPYVRESLGCTLGYTGPICCDMPRGGWGRIISDCPPRRAHGQKGYTKQCGGGLADLTSDPAKMQ